MKLIPGIQSFCGALGKWSCYAFCILKIAELITGKQYDVVNEILIANKRGWIKYNWDNHNDEENLYVLNPDAWIFYLTGMRLTVKKVYEKPDHGFIVECWNSLHFRLPDWDSMSYSNSVANGKITSWRVFN